MKRNVWFALLAVLLLLVGCGDPSSSNLQEDPGTTGYTVEETTINGMTCIIVESQASHNYTITSVDCDWSTRP